MSGKEPSPPTQPSASGISKQAGKAAQKRRRVDRRAGVGRRAVLWILLGLVLQGLVVIMERSTTSGGGSKEEEDVLVIKREDPSTILGKFLVGYQGWFTCAGDGPPIDLGHHGWLHWVDKPLADGGRITFDMWPSTRELDPTELYPLPGLSIRSTDSHTEQEIDRPARVFSSRDPRTVRRHFRWMREYDISGCFLQRFLGQVNEGETGLRRLRDEVGQRVRESAEAEGRVWAVMYDVSGIKGDKVEEALKADWVHLIQKQRILESNMYLRDEGRPVIGIWGMGFANDHHDPALLVRLLHWIRENTPGGAYIFAGVATHWQEGTGDADPNPGFADVWRIVDCISPWAVGRFSSLEEADIWKESQEDDMTVIRIEDESRRMSDSGVNVLKPQTRGRDFAPVVFPGFSWQNLHGGPYNEIPRLNGEFLYRQLHNTLALSPRIVYGAMFDEYDEATALMPSEPLRRNTPQELPFMSLEADGEVLPDDWYLRICGLAARALAQRQTLPKQFPRKLLEEYHNAPADPPGYAPVVHSSCAVAPPLPARTAPTLPPRQTSSANANPFASPQPIRRVAPLPTGGGLPERPARPPARNPGLESAPAEPPAPPSRVDTARQQAETLLGQVVTDERKREAASALNRLGKEANRLATPERQQKVLFGIGKLGSAGAKLLSDTRERVAKRDL